MSFWSTAKVKIKNSLKIIGYSFSSMWQDKNYLLFVLLSMLTFLLIIIIVAAIIEYTVTLREAFNFMEDISRRKETAGKLVVGGSNLLILIVSLLVVKTIGITTTTLFAVATSFYALKSFEQKKVGLWNALRYSLSKWWTILKWGVFAAIIGTILEMLTKTKKQKGGFLVGLLTRGLGEVLTLAWYLATFLVPAVIAFENFKVYASVKQSTKIMKKTFGETIVADFGFSMLSFIFLVGAPIAWIVVSLTTIVGILIPLGLVSEKISPISMSIFLGPAILIPVFALFFISIAKTIFKTAVYAYATGKPTGNFPPQLIKTSFHKPDQTT